MRQFREVLLTIGVILGILIVDIALAYFSITLMVWTFRKMFG